MKLLNRFDVTVTTPKETAKEYPMTPVWGYFTFPVQVPSADIVPEVFVKMLDARPINSGFWFYAGGLTHLDYSVTVTDTVLDVTKKYQVLGEPSYVIADTSWSGQTPIPPPPPPNPHYRLLLIPVAFDNWVPKESQSFLEDACQCVVNGWNKMYGDSRMTSDLIWPPWPVAGPVPSCNLSFRSQVLKEVTAAGHTGQDIVVGPYPPMCGGRSNATYIISPCDSLGMTLSHEMGHRLGLQHTSSLPLGAQPVDLNAAFAAPWLDQYEYGGYDLMGTGGIPGCPEWILTGFNRDVLHLPTDLRLSWNRGPGTYLVYWLGGNYEMSIVGPYKGHYGGGNRNYIVGNFAVGDTWGDVTGGTLATINFGPAGQVSVSP